MADKIIAGLREASQFGTPFGTAAGSLEKQPWDPAVEIFGVADGRALKAGALGSPCSPVLGWWTRAKPASTGLG